ncbi:MAG: LON peptidase substrate-binding domain-containing protein [Dongiaceae bacterium]
MADDGTEDVARGPFEPGFAELPAELPIFPLPGALLLPGGKLPLNIFEKRYLAMTRFALRSASRMIGMIQPREEGDEDRPAVYQTGCAGRIVAFSETDDGRYLIALGGVARFRVVRELEMVEGFRRVAADFAPFAADLEDDTETAIDRDRLINALKAYFTQESISANWEAIVQAPDDKLVTTLAMVCPFANQEKQALLESPNLGERSRMMTALIEMAVLGSAAAGQAARH